MALAALIVAIMAALIALASAAYTRRQAVATEAAAAIEAKRLHDDLTPQLAVTCTEHGTGSLQAEMTLELTGPPGLDGLDEATIRIRDDIPDRKPWPGSDLTQEEISRVIWGPYRLNRGVRDTDLDGRTHGPFRLPKNEPYPLQLEQTTAPWTKRGSWAGQYGGKPVRLEITCRRAGHEPWILRLEAEVKPDPGSQVY
jgi:hypothetical protein